MKILFQLRNKSFFPLIVSISYFFLVILMGQNPILGLAPDSNDQFQSKPSQDFNFVAAGDFGCGSNAHKTITNMINKKPELVLALGDLSYQRKPDCWFNTISTLEMSSKFKIGFGEHDIDDNLTKYNQYIRHFNLSKPYYSFDYQNVHFLVMTTAKNPVVPYLKNSEQYQFVNEDLSNARKNSSIDWIIVSSFRPFYSSNTTHPGLDKLQDTYHRLFEKYDVDVVLQAHNHNYQRTYPISYNESKQFTPIIRDKNIDQYQNIKKGQIFITVGTGGENLYNFTGQPPYVAKQFTLNGFLNIGFTDNGSKMSGTFIDNKKGYVMDYFTIKKKTKNSLK